MAPSLVVADAPFKVYPGGVIAIRCTDWIADSGTAENDARAVAGEVVRETQTVATSIRTSPIGAYQEAVDTLEIDFSSLPIEGAVSNGMPYRLLLSLLIEGDWDTTNTDTLRTSTQQSFAHGCGLGFHGVPGSVLDSDPGLIRYKPRLRPHFVIVSFTPGIGDTVGNEVLHFRAYAQAGTTIEILLDQIYLIPFVTSGTKLGQWTSTDFEMVGGQHNTFGSIGYDPPETGTGFVDGADGGDANGKFTWMPFPEEDQLNETGADGGGDYQHAADDEYMVRVVRDDGYFIRNSQVSGESSSLHAYSLHGSNYREEADWIDDDFSRTVASGWGTGPQGFGYWTDAPSSSSVDGSRGILNVGAGGDRGMAFRPTAGFPSGDFSAEIRSVLNFIVSGTFEYNAIPTHTGSGDFDASTGISVQDLNGNADWNIYFQPVTPSDLGRTPGQIWWIQSSWEPFNGSSAFFGPIDVSSWFAAGSPVGFKVEVKRYRLRVKIWDASGAEPGTWDYDDFPPVGTPPSGTLAYPYNDDLEISTEQGPFEFFLESHGLNTNTPHVTYWDDLLYKANPYGDPGDMTAVMETPHGTQVAEIDIPYGAWQMVYWGARNWTDFVPPFDGPNLDFSSKVWNESGSAELQRAEAPFWWFRSMRGGIVSMNYRIADRSGVATRVLIGG